MRTNRRMRNPGFWHYITATNLGVIRVIFTCKEIYSQRASNCFPRVAVDPRIPTNFGCPVIDATSDVQVALDIIYVVCVRTNMNNASFRFAAACPCMRSVGAVAVPSQGRSAMLRPYVVVGV
jgi:hypothetical protein